MEQNNLVPFSSVVAALLLLDRNITAVDIANFLCMLECEGLDVYDADDDMENLFLCVQDRGSFSYSLKDGIFYDTVLEGKVTVWSFLKGFVDERVLHFVQNEEFYSIKYKRNYPGEEDNEVPVSFNKSFLSGILKRSLLRKERKPLKRDSSYSFFV